MDEFHGIEPGFHGVDEECDSAQPPTERYLCECPTYDGSKCAAKAHRMQQEKALRYYGHCHCDCHEDDDGQPITKAEWQLNRVRLLPTTAEATQPA